MELGFVVCPQHEVIAMTAIEHLLEAAVYVDDLARAREFYSELLALPLIGEQAGRHVFFRAGSGVLLVFDAKSTLAGDTLPPHGTTGPGHVALGIPDGSIDDWRAKLKAADVLIEHEHDWPRGGRSLYFRDPAGNSVELVTRGCWGLPSGW